MKVVFIAGPFRASTPWGVEQNIRRAEELALRVWQLGGAAICPHTNTRFFDKSLPDEVFLEGIQGILRKCDGMVVRSDSWNSKGTNGEISLAVSLNIPIWCDCELDMGKECGPKIDFKTWVKE